MVFLVSEDRFNGVIATLAIKAPCIAAQTIPLADLEGLLVIDGFQTADGDRVLLVNQTDPIENGIYNASTGLWPRAVDFDGNRDITRGTIVNVNRAVGTSAVYEVTTIPDPVIDVDPINFRLWYDSGQSAACAPVNPLGFTILNQVLGSVANTVTINYGLGQGITLNLTEDITNVVFLNICPGNVSQLEFDIRQDSVPWTITWPGTVKWRQGTAPNLSTPDSITQVHLRSTDGGAEWLGTFSENHA
jgi:hypothetical protein